jgi:hypothetical protein
MPKSPFQDLLPNLKIKLLLNYLMRFVLVGVEDTLLRVVFGLLILSINLTAISAYAPVFLR